MTLTLFCMIALGISALLLIAAIVSGIVLNKKELARGGERKFALAPFHVFLLGFALAAIAMFFPIYYTDFLAGDIGFVKVIKSLLLSIHNVLRLFVLDGEFDNVRDLVSDTSRVNAVAGTIYSIYAAILYVTAPALTASVVLSFFKGASAILKYALYPHSDIYILSELNERSIILAQDILMNKHDEGVKEKGKSAEKNDESVDGNGKRKNKHRRRRRLVVFADVYEKEEESNVELISQAKRLGAICMRKDVLEIGLKRSKNIFRKIYLIGDDEDENINQALTLIERCGKSPRYNTDMTQIYVFANSTESEVLLNSINSGQLKVRRVNENRNLIIHTLSNYSIFKSARPVNGKMEISIAIIGLGAYGMELLKAVCWCGQMPGYNVTIHAFDKAPDVKEKIKSVAPELIHYNDTNMTREPHYKLIFHSNIDVDSYAFQEEISKIPLITSAFVTLGDDEMNIEAAMKLRVQLGRDAIAFGREIPPIFAVVYSMSKTQAAGLNGLKNMEGKEYGISFIGSIQSRYCVESIEQKDLEDDGLKRHVHWLKTRMTEEEATKQYNKYEYFRRSSIAEVIYRRYRDHHIPNCPPEVQSEYEHRRWGAYMRSEGFIGMGKDHERDFIAKTHSSLIPGQQVDLTKQIEAADKEQKSELKTDKGAEQESEKKDE